MSGERSPLVELKKNKSDCRYSCLLLSSSPCAFYFLYHHVSQHSHATVASFRNPTPTVHYTGFHFPCLAVLCATCLQDVIVHLSGGISSDV